jgi:hypothetical protein
MSRLRRSCWHRVGLLSTSSRHGRFRVPALRGMVAGITAVGVAGTIVLVFPSLLSLPAGGTFPAQAA